ncbi:MAG: hypothetical protein ACRDKT_16790 [Actinomycetota bacterium]
MDKERLVRVGLVACLFTAPVTGIACDREDQRDVEQVGRDIEKEIDEADKDGKDD